MKWRVLIDAFLTFTNLLLGSGVGSDSPPILYLLGSTPMMQKQRSFDVSSSPHFPLLTLEPYQEHGIGNGHGHGHGVRSSSTVICMRALKCLLIFCTYLACLVECSFRLQWHLARDR